MYDYLCRHGYVNEHNAKISQLGLNRVKCFLLDLAYTVVIGVGAYVILGAQVDVKINLTDLNKWVSDRIIESLTGCPIQE